MEKHAIVKGVKRLRRGIEESGLLQKKIIEELNQMTGGNTNGSESTQQSECVLGFKLLGSSVAHQ